jgi:hypothetical protein
VDLKILQKLLNLFPNFAILELQQLTIFNKHSIKLTIGSKKFEKIEISDCIGYQSVLESLETCAIKEAEFRSFYEKDPEKFPKFLENSLKKLTLQHCHFDVTKDLKDLRLEYLSFDGSGQMGHRESLEFLKQQIDLKFLQFSSWDFSEGNLSALWELKNLESLEITIPYRLASSESERSGLNQLHKLEKLRRLKVSYTVDWNILDHLRFGVFENLEELDTNFELASLESIREMKKITPNLKKLGIRSASSHTIHALLDNLGSLESLNIYDCREWEISDKVYPNIKHLDHFCELEFIVERIPEIFPNLEYLNTTIDPDQITESLLVALLSGLERLKSFYVNVLYIELEPVPELYRQCLQDHGAHLIDAIVGFGGKFAIEKKPGRTFFINTAKYSYFLNRKAF